MGYAVRLEFGRSAGQASGLQIRGLAGKLHGAGVKLLCRLVRLADVPHQSAQGSGHFREPQHDHQAHQLRGTAHSGPDPLGHGLGQGPGLFGKGLGLAKAGAFHAPGIAPSLGEHLGPRN